MTQLILDDQLAASEVLRPLREWTTAKRLGDLRPGELILDDRVPEILRTLNQPTFITIDQDFWKSHWCNPGYCIAYFAFRDDQQDELPGLLRSLFREDGFRIRKDRMGKVIRVSPVQIDFWEFPHAEVKRKQWTRAQRGKT